MFLEHGFEAVSYEQLAKEVGLSKPSLYNTFGDKSALFERVLKDYAHQAVTFSVTQFESGETLQEGVAAFLHAAAVLYSKQNALSQGCLLIGTALPACAQSGDVRQTLANFIQSLEMSLKQVVATKFKSDAQRLEHSPQALSMLLSSLLFSLAIRARIGMSEQELHDVSDEIIGIFPALPKS